MSEAMVGIDTAQSNQSVPKRTRACLACGRDYQAYARHVKDQRFCSAVCRARWHREHPKPEQPLLVFEPPPAPIQPLDVGPTTAQIQRAQARQTVRVLHMLQEAGPRGVTTGEFLEAHIGRFSARLGELRAVGWTITSVKESNHAWRFVLEGRQ